MRRGRGCAHEVQPPPPSITQHRDAPIPPSPAHPASLGPLAAPVAQPAVGALGALALGPCCHQLPWRHPRGVRWSACHPSLAPEAPPSSTWLVQMLQAHQPGKGMATVGLEMGMAMGLGAPRPMGRPRLLGYPQEGLGVPVGAGVEAGAGDL